MAQPPDCSRLKSGIFAPGRERTHCSWTQTGPEPLADVGTLNPT